MAEQSENRRDVRRRDREQQIIAAARALFREKRFEGTNISDIAAWAGTATGTVYLYAEDKTHLLHMVLSEFVEELITDLESKLSTRTDPIDRVRFVIEKHLETLLAEPELCALFVREVHTCGRGGAQLIHTLKHRYSSVLTKVLDEAMTAGAIRTDIPLGVARSVIFGGLEQLTLKTWTGRAPIDIQSATDGLMRILMPAGSAPPQALAVDLVLKRLEAVADRLEKRERPADGKPVKGTLK